MFSLLESPRTSEDDSTLTFEEGISIGEKDSGASWILELGSPEQSGETYEVSSIYSKVVADHGLMKLLTSRLIMN